MKGTFLPSISTSNIPHVAEDGDWFGVQTEGNKFTDIRSIKKMIWSF